ncbi:hypothetical protein ACHAWF_010892 [Thalassiosira exigua]
MITSFFKPKSTPGGKRPREAEGSGGGAKRRGVVTPTASAASASASSSPSSCSSTSSSKVSLSGETATLLSFIRRHEGPPADPSWRGALEGQFATAKFASLAQFVARERSSKTIYPPPELTFSALNLTPLHKVKVVVVGQDPYHQPNQGHGLSFSVPPGVKIPPSLRNIYKELYNDDGVETFTSIPQHGNLERWAKQGVLLLNNVLTVRKGEAASHSKRGWEQFTDGVIGAVVERDDAESTGGEKGTGVVFLLWGKPASSKAQTVLAKYSSNKRSKHAVIMCSHPSPLGATKTKSSFMGSRCFSRANEELVRRGWKPIDWRVDGDPTSAPNDESKSQPRIPHEDESENAADAFDV